ncbi:hypothetical protein PF005_g7176 [Phytophthora fragariae]|uniref:Uncharacterized protein n=1 Tax=Phytophthora fragariae TaxID=53985 RepID=A0A6A3UQ55_9STRA|nr:hypothetical protein PF011_g10924 [Phytophthora fragariae]KAE9130412.1 hypothetical protein PF010_g3853 [Phytophthora fragariae]KAE9152431.1 hypothetical protein PF006_g3343 [Phytophthora fragariae]KAE9221245.1 hypothetical protein PF005_g7176 [Phytophthora fragariae]KAE9243291.1 hypothetical protein PF004_g6211 [Phytophthora fragariae]
MLGSLQNPNSSATSLPSIGIPISIQGILGSFVDYSIPYSTDCRLIHYAMQLALQQERQ